MLSYEKCRPSRGQPDFAPDGNSLAKFKSIEGVFLRPVRYRRIPDRNMIHPPLSAFSQRLKIVGFLALILVKGYLRYLPRFVRKLLNINRLRITNVSKPFLIL